MAAISFATMASEARFVRSGTAQADVGQVDYIPVPGWAKYAFVYFNLTAVAGTTPIATLAFRAPDPVAKDDAYVVNISEHAALTGITAACQTVVQIGPGVTGIADDVTNAAAADSYVSLNAVLPPILAVALTLDRGTADETYTYNLTVIFRS